MIDHVRVLAAGLLLLVSIAGCDMFRPPVPDVAEITPSADSTPTSVPEITFAETDWPWWRGPQRDGVAAGAAPVEWSSTKNIVWSAPVPGRGHSSPTVVGDRVILATADDSAQTQSVLAFDRTTGEQLWETQVHQGGFPSGGQLHQKSTNANCTVACDGERLFVAFLNHAEIHATALSLDGEIVWQTTLGPFASKFGYAPSPALWGPLALFAADHRDGGFLAGVNRLTGEIVWRRKRPAVATYSSPVVAELGGRPQLVISGGEQISSYDPMTGESLWSVRGTAEATCGTVVWDGDLVFASGGYPQSETICVRADGSGEVWKNRQKCYEQSMLAHDGYLYAVTDRGIAYCWEAATGKEQWKGRLSSPVSASPVLADGHIYVCNEGGTMYVFRADPGKFDLVSENLLGDSSFSTPAVCGGQMFFRVSKGGQGTLYCIGTAESESLTRAE